MDKLLKYSIIIATAVVAVSAFYYFVIFLPGEQKAFREQQLKIEAEKRVQQEMAEINKHEQQQARKSELIACLGAVQEAYLREWSSNCRSIGRSNDCSLRQEIAVVVDKHRDAMKEDCFRLYP